jgi:hypothetical protein
VIAEKLAKPGIETFWEGVHPVLTAGGEKPPVPDLSKLNYLTVVVRDAGEREQLRAQAKASGLARAFQLNVWGPEDWQTSAHKLDRDTRFQQSGRVAIVQAPSVAAATPGQALRSIYAWSSLQDLESQLDGLAARKPNEPYDPNAVPSPGLGAIGGSTLILFALIGAGIYVVRMPASSGQWAVASGEQETIQAYPGY